MSFDTIRECLEKEFSGLHLLNIIPSHESLVWIPFSGGVTPTALVIGQVQGRDILAYIAQMGDKPIEARYCSKPAGDAKYYAWKPVPQDDIMLMKLNAPFKYNADPSKASKRKFSIIIKWYFMVKGLVTDSITGDIHDYCKRLSLALERIAEGQRADGTRDSIPAAGNRAAHDKTPDTIDESPEPIKNVYSLRSTQPAENGDTGAGATQPPELRRESLSSGDDTGVTFNYQELCDYLAANNCSHFLKNIHEVDELQFFLQDVQPEAQPRKLFLGRTKDLRGEIYAYMLSNNGTPSIELWIEDTNNGPYRSRLRMEDVSRETLNHPFNKTFLPSSVMLSEGEQSRLKALIAWYFIAADVACVSREVMSHYPKLLRNSLAYIADRMGPAAVQPHTSISFLPPSYTPTLQFSTPNTPPAILQISTPNKPPPTLQISAPNIPLPTPHSVTASPVPTARTLLRAPKRTAEDAIFEDIHRNIEQDVTLTREINAVDQELEMLEIKKERLLAKWNKEWEEVVGRREKIAGERQDVRKRFKRLSMGIEKEG
jgi:hypothetical protein